MSDQATLLPGEKLLLEIAHSREVLRSEIGKTIVGLDQVVDDVILNLFCGEHAILTGVPGLAKTLLVRTLSEALSLDFNRIQFTPDLMPADITGTDVIHENPETGKRELEFLQGPVFTNLLLADEINRTPAKTQAAMLQTMQEQEVSVGSVTHKLPEPFHVFATQNPIEQEGTYQLPEAALDRFMLSIHVGYPSVDDEITIVEETTGNAESKINPVLNGDDLIRAQKVIRDVPVAQEVTRYAVELVSATRPKSEHALEETNELIRWGAGPRASQYLILGAKGRAAFDGRPCANYADVKSVARQVLEHRLVMNFKARAKEFSADQFIDLLLEKVPHR